jgi:AraC-like DNA-binding protein
MGLKRSHLLEGSARGTHVLSGVDWAQLEKGTFEVRHGILRAEPLTLTLRRMNLGFKSAASVTPNTAMIGLLADSRTRCRWFGQAADSSSIAASRTSIDLTTRGASAFYAISVDEGALCRMFPDAPDASDLVETTRKVKLSRDALYAARLRSQMRTLFDMARLLGRDRPLPSRGICGTLVPLLAAATKRFDAHSIEPSLCLNRRITAVRRCESYMRNHVDEALTLLDLSRVAGVRSRTLINAFLAITGFSPMDYLRRLRLNGVRRMLQRGRKPTTRVIDVAGTWGFWHMGHFTAHYRAMFGEVPSETLNAQAARAFSAVRR